jgi:DNA recombination protein RmuC
MVITLTGIVSATLAGLVVGFVMGKILEKNKTLIAESKLKADFDGQIKEIERRAFHAESKIKTFDDMSNQFENLANQILDKKSQKFAEESKKDLGALLDPVKTQLTDFKSKIENLHTEDGKDRASLKSKIDDLVNKTGEISGKAENLTNALMGNSKTQGNWGEIVLERVLEGSGLRKGEEYTVQQSHTSEEGSRLQPDVIIRLPEGRYLIVDSKVSLKAYTDMNNADDEPDQKRLLKDHINSIRTHIKGLSNKNYQSLYGINSLDFVLMFIPVEPAFMTAISHENDLLMYAWRQNVLLVSPSTLLFVTRTVDHLWNQDKQIKNVQDIVKSGSKLYDKFVGFTEDINSIGQALANAQKAHNLALNKLTGERGLLNEANKLIEFGVKPTKSLPKNFISSADCDVSGIIEEQKFVE